MILRASPAMASSLAAIEKACFAVPWSAAALESFLAQANAAAFAAQTDGLVCGYIGMYTAAGEEGNITNLAVLPDYRRRGIGSALLKALIAFSREIKLQKLMLEVRASNDAAIRLYRSFGFITVGMRKNYYTRPVEHAVLMDKILSDGGAPAEGGTF